MPLHATSSPLQYFRAELLQHRGLRRMGGVRSHESEARGRVRVRGGVWGGGTSIAVNHCCGRSSL